MENLENKNNNVDMNNVNKKTNLLMNLVIIVFVIMVILLISSYVKNVNTDQNDYYEVKIGTTTETFSETFINEASTTENIIK